MKRKGKALRLTVRFLSFTLIFILINLSLSVLLTPKGDDEPEGMSNNIIYSYKGEEKDSVDIFFVGNSDVARGINPVYIWDEYNITSCTSGPSAIDYNSLFEKIMDACSFQKPKVIVIEVDCLFRASNKYYGLIKEEYEAKNKEEKSISDRLSEADDAMVSGLSYYWPIMKYHDRWSTLTREDFFNPNGRFKYSAKGYMYSDETTPFSYGDEYMSDKTSAAEKISEDERKVINDIVNYCNKNDIKLAFLAIPSGSSWTVKKHNAMVKLADELGIDFVDYNSNPELLDSFSWETDTKDAGNHMNYSGAMKVTKAYSAHLVELFSLAPSELSDEQIKEWNEDSRYFYSEIVNKDK